jgi:hypothetical protein
MVIFLTVPGGHSLTGLKYSFPQTYRRVKIRATNWQYNEVGILVEIF